MSSVLGLVTATGEGSPLVMGCRSCCFLCAVTALAVTSI